MTRARGVEGNPCNEEKRRGGGSSSAESQANGRQLRVDVRPLRLMVLGADGVPAPEAMIPVARRERGGRSSPGTMGSKDDGEDGEVAFGRVAPRHAPCRDAGVT